jgi:hypothetical protein
LLRQLADADRHDGVLRGVALSAWVLREEIDDAADVLERVAARATVTGHRESALEACTEAAGHLWVLFGHRGARQILDRLIDLDSYKADAVTAMLHEIRVSGAFTSDDDGTRQRAIELCAQLVDSALAATGDLLNLEPDPSDARRQQIKTGLEVLDSVASQLYFASGAHDARRDNTVEDATLVQVRLADEAVELIARVGSVPLPRITHHLVEMLEHVLDARPERTLLGLRDIVVTGGQQGGYQLDKMAVDLVVRIVDRLLADHRGILQAPECLTALRQILDVFVEAGWPSAHRLAYGLEHIFR